MGCLSSVETNFDDKTFDKTPNFSLIDKFFSVRVVDIYDGDTCTCVLNVFDTFYKFTIRLMDIDTCEMTSKDNIVKDRAYAARNRLYQLITKDESKFDPKLSRKDLRAKLNSKIYMISILCGGFDKYGRLLAYLFDVPTKGIHFNINETYNHILIKENYAYNYNGDTKLTENEQKIFLQ
jgi:endonuclease YncB( thermonuclease family)